MSVGVIGAGAFGTALAIVLGQQAPVRLWARDPDQARALRSAGENTKRLRGAALGAGVTVTADLGDLDDCDTLLLCVPMQRLRGFVEAHRQILGKRSLVACCKGVETRTGVGPLDILAELCPDAPAALLTGPSFAADIARGLPTALTLACADADLGEALQHDLATPALRLYRTTDVTGASLGGALKNVMAIACGVAMGAGLGESARAALITRGFAEMQRLAVARGADPATLAGLSGLGDLVLTCTSAQSRNYRLGLSIGQGGTFDPEVTVEGAATAIAIAGEARAAGIEMPISTAVAGLVENRLDVAEAMDALLSRSLKEE